MSNGVEARFHDFRSADDWAGSRLQEMPNGSRAEFFRAHVEGATPLTGAPWDKPFSALEKNEYGRVVRASIL